MDHLLTIWSIRISIVCLFSFLISQSLSHRGNREADSNIPTLFVSIWLIGAVGSSLHLLFAMGWIHNWSHAEAWKDTAKQTEELLGVRVGIGIYFNYVFVVAWLLDAGWMTGWHQTYVRRPNWITKTIYGYLVFIAINGAIVFEPGIVRWVTVLLLVIWLGVMWGKFRR